MRPASRGRLGLKSTDPNDSPMFQSSILEHPEDMDVLRRGVRLAREIFNQLDGQEFQGEEIWPGSDISSKIGSNTLDDAIRSQAHIIYHPAGTCRMGPTDSDVVDLKLRVRGVSGKMWRGIRTIPRGPDRSQALPLNESNLLKDDRLIVCSKRNRL